MRTSKHYRDLMTRNPNARVGFALAAAAVYAARNGLCEAPDHSSEEFRRIALMLKRKYEEVLSADEVLAEMDAAEEGSWRRETPGR